MNVFSIYNREDYLMIKWQIAYAIVGLIAAGAIFTGIEYLNGQSRQAMRIAQSAYDNALSQVALIEEEEATIIEYIGRYQELAAQGAVAEEDRLEMHERIADIRAENNLFPVTLNIDEQLSMPLQYAPDVAEPGDPVALHSSIINLKLPLLHEADLTRLLDGILSSPGLFQARECNITQQDTNTRNFIVLAQHFNAECEILWHTFDLDPPPPEDPFGF